MRSRAAIRGQFGVPGAVVQNNMLGASNEPAQNPLNFSRGMVS